MATGAEFFDALSQKVRPDLGTGTEIRINQVESYDLRKLRPSDLTKRDFDLEIAERISSGLREGDLDPLAEIWGVRLVISHEAPRLLPG